MGGQTFGFEENLVAVFVGEAVDFVFDRRAVARADAFDLPVNMGLRSKPERMMPWVCRLVCVIQQDTWRGCISALPRTEKTGTGVSPGCSVSWEKSIVRPSMRGGVPVFRRP